MSLVATGCAIVCAVCVFAAPAFIDDSGVNMPPGLSRAGFENWAGEHARLVICGLPYDGPVPGDVTCPHDVGSRSAVAPAQAAPAALEALAVKIAKDDYAGCTGIFRGIARPGTGHILPPESAVEASCVIIAWLAGWTVLGAWRMTTRDT